MAGYQIESDICTGRGFAGVDADGFLAKFYTWVTKNYASGGPGWYIHDDQSTLGTNPYIVICDTAAPVVNDYNTGPSGGPPKFLKIGYVNTEAATIRIQCYMWWDNATQTGYGLWDGHFLRTYDAADFVYAFRGGAECMIIQTRRGTTWDIFVFDEWEGDTNLVEGTTAIGTLQSGVTAGSSVVLQLDTGEAANFTADKYYYLYDFDGHSWVAYRKVTAVDAVLDQITIDTADYNWPAGSVIGAYPHRWYTAGNQLENNSGTTGIYDFNYYVSRYSKLPYCSSAGTAYSFSNQSGPIYGACGADFMWKTIDSMNADDYGNRTVQRPLLYEFFRENDSITTTREASMNRAYGVAKNLYVGTTSGMAQMQDGRTINGKNYIYARTTSSFFSESAYTTAAVLILDTEATS